ncbi:hypothetical protein EC12741_B0194 [Escherichia coli 1.2741]|nr:hypothetical protein EC12741_B0194 [Escherichia coli 1.2741]
MHQKVDDEVVFCIWRCFFVRGQASGVQMPPARARIIQCRLLSGGSGGQPAVITVT